MTEPTIMEKAIEKAITDVLNNKKSTPTQKMQAANMGLKLILAQRGQQEDKDDHFFGR